MEPALGTTTPVKKGGKTNDIITTIIDTYEKDYAQTYDFAQRFRDSDIDNACSSIFDWVVVNIAYQQDSFGVQLVKTPARTYSDGFADCKSMAIFVASCLRNIGIKHYFRFVSFSTVSKEPTHVYIIAINEEGKEIVLDTVLKKFNQEAKYTYKKDMGTDIYYLAGIGVDDPNALFLGNGTHVKSPQEIDLYVNLNILNNAFRKAYSNFGDNSLEAARILDRIDLALMAIRFYELSATDISVDIDKLLSGVVYSSEAGLFDYSAVDHSTLDNTNRIAHFNELYQYILDNVNNYAPIANAHDILNSLTGDAVYSSDLKTLSWVYPTTDKIGAIGTLDATTQSELIQQITNSIEYYTYSFIPDNEVANYAPIVATKRAFHIELLTDYATAGVLTRDQSAKIIISELDRKYGLTPAAFLNALHNGIFQISGVPEVGFVALIPVIAAIVAALATLATVVTSLFGNKGIPSQATITSNVPSAMDLALINSKLSPTTAGTSLLGSGTSSNTYLYLAIGAAAIILLTGKKEKK